MALQTYTAAAVGANVPFTITVPGQRIWRILAVSATLSRAVGGTPNRALQLAVTNGTVTILTSPAADAGTEPGTLTATWTNAQPTVASSGSTGVTLGPLPVVSVYPGYVLTGTVLNAATGDAWTAAYFWVDETGTN